MPSEWSAIPYCLLGASLRVAAFAGMVALILAAARVRSNSVRHAAWTMVLLAMLLMPILPYVLPFIRIAFPVPVTAIQQKIGIPEAASSAAASLSTGIAQESIRGISNVQFPAPGHERKPAWPFALMAFYLMGVFILLARALWGLRGMSRIMRDSKPAAREHPIPRDLRRTPVPLYESEAIAAPLTAGILSPRIVLPGAWKKWPAHKLRAVLAHELSHVRRHDTLIAPLAHLNRCLF